VVITHNAVIAGMAHRVVSISDGQIQKIQVNESRCDADSLKW
jgi:putative ABC transport system ATP-binding protein